MGDGIESRLQACCARAFPDKQGVRVSDVASISAGWESDVYSFAVEHGPAGERRREALILRIYPGSDARDKSAREFRGMSQLHRAGYPVPQVLALGFEDSPFGKPFVIMERIEGQVLGPLWLDSPEEKRRELLTLFCKLFVQLHALDWQPFVGNVARYDTGDPRRSPPGNQRDRQPHLPGCTDGHRILTCRQAKAILELLWNRSRPARVRS